MILLAVAATSLTAAEGPGYITPAPKGTALGHSMLQAAGAPLNQGRILYDARLRFEHADQQGLRNANALTLRQRFGYETARFNGFYGVAEGEYNWVLNNGDFAPYPPPYNAGQTVIADPESMELNQLFAAYTGAPGDLKVGRQIINLGNQRYVGAVAWRQNNQTFDAVRVSTSQVPNLRLDYVWNWGVNRVFGSRAPTESLRRLRSNNHFINATFDGIDGVTVGAYTYILRLRNLTAASSNSYGIYVDGEHAFDSDMAWIYRAEFAYQTDNSQTSGPGYGETYINLTAGFRQRERRIGLTFERLGGNGTRAFQTPLATLHAFNGWSDTFLTTPPNGLCDYQLWAETPLLRKIQMRAEAHYFTAATNSETYGHEFGLSLSRKLTDNLSILVKAARYNGRNGAGPGISANKDKFWLQLDFRL